MNHCRHKTIDDSTTPLKTMQLEDLESGITEKSIQPDPRRLPINKKPATVDLAVNFADYVEFTAGQRLLRGSLAELFQLGNSGC